MGITDDEKYDDMISRYISGVMTEAESARFREELAADSALLDKAIATSRMALAMREVGREADSEIIAEAKAASRAEIESIAANACGNQAAQRRMLQWRKPATAAAAAAALLLCAAGGVRYYDYSHTTSLGKEYLTYFPAAVATRGESDSIAVQLKTIYPAITASVSERRAAIARLEPMWNQSRSDTYSDFTPYMPEIGWMLANAYLCDNNKTRAAYVLGQLIALTPEGSAIGDKARELKARL